jgi:hypothetical protein
MTTERSNLTYARLNWAIVSLLTSATFVAGVGCSDDDDPAGTGGTSNTTAVTCVTSMTTAGTRGNSTSMAGAGGGTMTMAGAGGGMMGSGPAASAMGVEFPTGFEDWSVIGMARRLDTSQIRVVVGNTTAVDAARAALPGRPASWPEGSVLVDVVRPEATNPEWAGMVGPGAFGAIAVMEKNSTRFADTGNWGYGFWNAALDSAGNLGDSTTGADTATCYGCHNSRVPDQDYVFTLPLPFPSDALVSGAAVAPNGSTLPANVTRWRVLSAHHRTDNGQMRLVLGNDTAVDAWRAGTVTPTWPDGTQLADVLFASEELAAGAMPNQTNMVAPTTWAAIAFMERDPQAHAATDDWGYTAFRVVDSETSITGASSTAADADDVATCYGCHNTEVEASDYVFTVPGGLPDNLP